MHSTQDKKNILEINKLSISIGKQALVRDVSLSIASGSILGVVGESGAGKSLTAHAILQLLPDHLKCQGQILFQHEDILQYDLKKLQSLCSGKIGMVFQDPLSSLNPCHQIKKQLEEAIIIHQKRRPSIDELGSLLKQVDLRANLLNCYPHQLSGGQRQRVMIAMALSNQPELIICDEATTALDVTTQKQILDLIAQIAQEKNIAILMITHNLSVISYIADHVVVLKKGEIIERSICADFFIKPQTTYGQQLLSSFNLTKSTHQPSNQIILEAKNMSVRTPENQTHFLKKKEPRYIIKQINLTLYAGSTLALVGESGAGKTTIAKALLGLLPSEGSITQNSDFSLQYIFQDPHAALNPRAKAIDILSEPFYIKKSQPDHAKIKDILDAVNLDMRICDLYPHELSGGQKQRLALARTLLLEPKVLILDEPTSALDATTQNQVIGLLLQLKEKFSLTFILITHDLSLVAAICDQVIVLKDGQIIESGTQHEIFNNPSHPYTHQLLDASLLRQKPDVLCDD